MTGGETLAGARACCRRRCVLPNSDGTSFDASRLRGRDLSFGPKLLDRLPSESVPGCILLDVRMPGLNGPELQERLGKLGLTLPIIFITGYPDIPTTVRPSERAQKMF